ncbi:MAG: TIGR02147 family protein [Proteobacteria bacterium]|nr:MAG: TIGR02147 family protein [Pseudomonadota bacterium]
MNDAYSKAVLGSSPVIFDYNDFRIYLSDFYNERKSKNISYSHRVFARQAGLSSPSHLHMIIKGQRNLSLKTIEKFSDGIKLTVKEREYFQLLVQFNQSTDLQMKAKFFSEMIALKASTKKLHRLEKEKFDFLSKWYVVAIYVLIDLKDFSPDPLWIVKKLAGRITVAQAKEALNVLLKLDMIVSDPELGWSQRSGAVTVADDTKSIAVFNYHQAMIRLASEALNKSNLTDREMNGATIAIPKDKLSEIKDRIREFRMEINQLASSYSCPDEVFQLNIQLFPLTELESK